MHSVNLLLPLTYMYYCNSGKVVSTKLVMKQLIRSRMVSVDKNPCHYVGKYAGRLESAIQAGCRKSHQQKAVGVTEI